MSEAQIEIGIVPAATEAQVAWLWFMQATDTGALPTEYRRGKKVQLQVVVALLVTACRR